jgi:hypothetical protein
MDQDFSSAPELMRSIHGSTHQSWLKSKPTIEEAERFIEAARMSRLSEAAT